MTTIVVDAKVGYMAADRKVTTNDCDVAIPCNTKIEAIYVGGDRYLVGAAGMEGPAEHFLEWFREGEWDDPPEPWDSLEEDDSFSIVLLGPNGISVVDKFMRMIPIDYRYYGAGSGGPFAWAILEAGCGIDKAMSTALRMDPNSGFGYQVRYLETPSEDYDVLADH